MEPKLTNCPGSRRLFAARPQTVEDFIDSREVGQLLLTVSSQQDEETDAWRGSQGVAKRRGGNDDANYIHLPSVVSTGGEGGGAGKKLQGWGGEVL